MTERVIIVGGGIAGLATAFELTERGIPALVLEGSSRLGGNIRTTRDDGFTVEWGPNGFLDNVPETLDLIRRIGAEGKLQPSSDASRRRFLYRRGRLRELPAKPLKFLASGILTIGGRLRVLGEPFAKSAPPAADDESVHAFASRRIGRQAADVLVDAMVSGVFAGDSRRLSLRSTFPKMHAMESKHGSLFKAMRAIGKARREARRHGEEVTGGGPAGPGGHLTSFADGFETLVTALLDALPPESVRTGARVARIERSDDVWRVTLADGESLAAESVILAVPAWDAARATNTIDATLSDHLDAIPGAGLAVVAAAWRDEDLPGPLDGFGFLIPRGEGPRSLGTLWDSSVFPGRAPEGHALLRTMIGGAHDPEALEQSDEDLLATVLADLNRTMGISTPPRRTWIFRHPRGIPQYERGHGARLDAIEDRLARHPGLHLTGNSYQGVSVNLCVVDAARVAERVAAERRRS